MSLAQLTTRGIDVLLVASLGIHHTHQTNIGQFLCTDVVNLQSHHVVLTIGNLQGLKEILCVVEIAEHERCAASFSNAGQELQRLLHIGTMRLRFEVEQFTDDIEDMLAAFLGRDIFLDTVGEEHHANLIIVLDGAEG